MSNTLLFVSFPGTTFNIMIKKNNLRFVYEQHRDEEVQPYIQQLINSQNYSQSESHSTESNHLNNSASTNDGQSGKAGNSIVTINFLYL